MTGRSRDVNPFPNSDVFRNLIRGDGLPGRSSKPDDGAKGKARLRLQLRRGRLLPKLGFERSLVEAVGIEPTSEGLRSPVSPCAAGYLISPRGQLAGNLPRGQPENISVTAVGRDGNPARLTSSIPGQRAEPREGRGYLGSQCVVVIGSCNCLHPFYERMALDTLPTTETVPRRTQYAPKLDSHGEFITW